MKLTKRLAGATAAMSTIVLAGCGGGGSSEFIKAVFAEDAGTTIEALDAGKTLTAYNEQMSSSARRTEGVWASTASPEFSVKKNDQGGIDVTLGDEMVSFTPADREVPSDPGDPSYGWEKSYDDGNFRGVFTSSDTGGGADDVLNGNTRYAHHQVWSYFWGTDGGETFNGHAVIGTETQASALEGKANATYHGWARADLYAKGSDSFDRTRITGDVELNADFGAGEISGAIGDMRTATRTGGVWGPESNVAGFVNMNTAKIDGNSFSGTMSGNGTPFDDFDGGSYGGKFYGENGEEVGGVLSLEDEDVVGSGFFTAGQTN